jgi:acetylornithine/N-succinyldiaminopimelate aminotransferase
MNPTEAAASTAAKPGPLNPLLTGPGEYPFVRLDRMKHDLMPAGLTPINFSIGDPRERTPEFIRETLRAAVPEVSSYPSVAGQAELRQAFTGWFARRFGVTLDPETHVLPANGTKEAVFLMAFAVVGKDSERRTVVIPAPAYPVYEPAARFAGGEPLFMPLRSEDGWKFEPDRVPESVWAKTAMLWLNTPHNPTGSVLDLPALQRIAALARRHGFWVIADEAYADLYFDQAPHSMLECGLDNVLVLHTLSKRSAMTGYRSGFIAGDPRLIAALRRLRPNVGVATPEFIQVAATAAWKDDAHAEEQRGFYAAKRSLFMDYFARRGWSVEASEATFYLWFRAPGGDDVAFVERLLGLGLVALPGSFLGAAGAGFVRWALVPTLAQCREAIARLEAAGAALEAP